MEQTSASGPIDVPTDNCEVAADNRGQKPIRILEQLENLELSKSEAVYKCFTACNSTIYSQGTIVRTSPKDIRLRYASTTSGTCMKSESKQRKP